MWPNFDSLPKMKSQWRKTKTGIILDLDVISTCGCFLNVTFFEVVLVKKQN